MTAINRPTTPAFLSEQDNNGPTNLNEHHNNNADSFESPHPCTPPHSRLPMIFSQAPMAPRPRKRVFHPLHFEEGDLDDLMMPCSLPDIPSDDEEETPMPLPRFPLSARLAPARVLRRRLQPNDGDEEAVVRLAYRQSFDDTPPEYSEDSKENHNSPHKLISCQSSAPLNYKRRYSLGATCA